MAAIRYGPNGLFEYNLEYKVLICRQCQYAVQKNAFESHLLRHKIYRGDRQDLLSSLAQLELLDPDDVPLPPPDSEILLVLLGFRCSDAQCRHLTASTKLLKRRWSAVHDLEGAASFSSLYANEVKLQTFFRGTKIRYFEVDSPVEQNHNLDDVHDVSSAETQSTFTVAETLPSRPYTPRSIKSIAVPAPSEFNIATLFYFHNFTMETIPMLPGFKGLESHGQYWQSLVIGQALQHHWLMAGLLAISVLHLAALSSDTLNKKLHHEQQMSFTNQFCTGLEPNQSARTNSAAAEMGKALKDIGEQVRCLLKCAQWALGEDEFELDLEPSSQLLLNISAIRGCAGLSHVLSLLNFDCESDGSQKASELPMWPQTNTHVQGNPQINALSNFVSAILLERVNALPFLIAERIERPENGEDVIAVLAAIQLMVECVDIRLTNNKVEAAWEAVVTWLSSVSQQFNEMLLHHHTVAMLVLAYWAAMLVNRAEQVGCWFLKGTAERIILQVTMHLFHNASMALDLVDNIVQIMKI